jgi:hypothetical protein
MKGSHKKRDLDNESLKRKRMDKEKVLTLRRKRDEKQKSKESPKFKY